MPQECRGEKLHAFVSIRFCPHREQVRNALQQRIIFVRQRRQRLIERGIPITDTAISDVSAPEEKQASLTCFKLLASSAAKSAEIGTREHQFRPCEHALDHAQRLEPILLHRTLALTAKDQPYFADLFDTRGKNQFRTTCGFLEFKAAKPFFAWRRLLSEGVTKKRGN